MATILIVDDHSVHRNFLMALLGEDQHRLLGATDGLEALQMAAAEHPDLIITDIMMPRMDGYQFTLRLRSDPVLAATPVIFYTSTYSTSEASAMAQKCGVHCVLPKPSPPQRIVAAVHDALRLPSTPVRDVGAQLPPPGRFAAIDTVLSRGLDAPNAAAGLARAEQMPMGEFFGDVQSLGVRLTSLIDMGIELASERNAQRLIETGCRIARHIGVAQFSVVAIASAGGKGYAHFSTRGLSAEVHEQLALAPPPGGIFDEVRSQRRAQRLHGLLGRGPIVGLCAQHPDVDSLIAVPIATVDHDYGWIYLGNKLGADRFSEIDEEVLLAVATQTAVAYENILLFDRVQLNVRQLEREVLERRLITQCLQESEAQFRQLTENIAEVFFLMDTLMTRILYISPAYERIWGRSCDSLYAAPLSWTEALHPDDLERVYQAEMQRRASGTTKGFGFDWTFRVVRPDGTMRVVHARGFPIRDENEAVYRVGGIIEDISDYTSAMHKVARLSRIHAVQSEINATLVRAHEREPLLREACRVAVDQGAFSMAWVGLIGPPSADGRIINWLEDWSDDDIHQMMLDAVRLGPTHPASRAARELRTVICDDIAAEPALAPLSAALSEKGHRALAAVPLVVEGRAVAVMALFSGEAGFFDKEEQRLLADMGADLSFGLSYIEKAEQINFLAYYDALTNLPNRLLFCDRVSQSLRDQEMAHTVACVVLIDIDRFGQVNDVLGRSTGDELLRLVAQRLRTSLNEAHSVARISGDIFGLILPNLPDGMAAAQVEQTVLDALEVSYVVDGQVLSLSARAGVAVYPQDGVDAETLLKHAELAAKKAKSARVRVQFYSPQLNTANVARLEMEGALRQALVEQQFVLHYQPRVDMESGRIVSAEALVRWQHPQRGLVPPGQFIFLCEEIGLIDALGAWIIDAVCAQQAAWRDQGIDIVPVAVNLSALQFRKGNLLQTIAQATARNRLEQKYLEFELTESVVMGDPDQARLDLQALKSIGALLSLDDFGTGYSSLAYLQRFPFDFVKIDRAFVLNITTSPADAAICSAIVAMAHSLKLDVVAEGVETEGQLRFLRGLNCDQFQGYFFSPAVEADAFATMLRDKKSLVLAILPQEKEHTLLIVDDEPHNLSALNRLLRREGYRVLLAHNGQEGLELLALNDVQVIISDQRMPSMSGTQFLSIVKELYPDTVRIILSGYTDLEVVTNSVNQGAVFKFLTKPWDDELLRGHIREAFRRYFG